MIAKEVSEFRANAKAGGQGASLPSIPKPTEPLPGPNVKQGNAIDRDDKDHDGPMDIDEELRMKGH
jgi:hypothetical protein